MGQQEIKQDFNDKVLPFEIEIGQRDGHNVFIFKGDENTYFFPRLTSYETEVFSNMIAPAKVITSSGDDFLIGVHGVGNMGPTFYWRPVNEEDRERVKFGSDLIADDFSEGDKICFNPAHDTATLGFFEEIIRKNIDMELRFHSRVQEKGQRDASAYRGLNAVTPN